jgi:general stress protein 26
MNSIENLNNTEAITKLKDLVDDIKICLFCTNLKMDDGSTCSPMSALKVCDEGSIWFFSEKSSDKNKAILKDKNVQLMFSHPGKNSYLVLYGEAEIILDKTIIEDLWTPVAKTWFKEGIDDPNISIIKVKPSTAYYWDTDGNRMINFLKMLATAITGTTFITDQEGAITVSQTS